MRTILLLLCLSAASVSGCTNTWYGSTGETTPQQPRQCGVVGAWRGMIQGGMLAGRPVELTFYDNGTARGVSGAIILDQAWTLEGNSLTVRHIDSVPPAAACPVEQVGIYSIEFSGDCNTVTATSVTDPCEHRRRTLHGLRVRRQ